MTMMTHAHNPHLLRDHSSSATDVSDASHLVMIKRFARFALTLMLFAVALITVMAIRVVAWFPPFYH